jgi:hypothetical protein
MLKENSVDTLLPLVVLKYSATSVAESVWKLVNRLRPAPLGVITTM